MKKLKEAPKRLTAAADKLLTMVEENQSGEKCLEQLTLVEKEKKLLRKKAEEITASCTQEVKDVLTQEGGGTARHLPLLLEIFQKTKGRQGTSSDVGQGSVGLIPEIQRNYLKLMLQTPKGRLALCYEGILDCFLLRWAGEGLDLVQCLIREWP